MEGLRKIFGAVIILAMFIFPQIVSAEKTDWRDQHYSFKRVRTVVVLNLQNDADLSSVGRVIQAKLDSDYFSKSKKLKCEVLTEDQARRLLGMQNASRNALKNNLSQIADMWVEGNIHLWRSDYRIVPARTVWEEKKRTRRVRDRWGDWIEETYYESVPVTYPPYRIDTSYITSVFEAYDAKTGKPVFMREDNRDRNDADAQKDMFGRMCNSFFEDLNDKIR